MVIKREDIPNIQAHENAVAYCDNRLGVRVPFTARHLHELEALCASGHSLRYIAFKLGMDESGFKQLIKHTPSVQEAIKNGLARDEQEITSVLRNLAMAGDRKAINDYLEYRHSKASNSKASGVTVQINTNIERGNTIEHKG